jgi:hypothetical protein
MSFLRPTVRSLQGSTWADPVKPPNQPELGSPLHGGRFPAKYLPGMPRLTSLFSLLLASAFGSLAVPAALPPYAELRELVRTNALQVSGEQLDEAAATAVLGLVHGQILEAGEVLNEESEAPAIADKRRFEPGCLYVRVGQVTLGLAPQLAAALADPALTTNCIGLVLDLRFAGGTEYAGAAAVANLFSSEAGPLLDWGADRAESTAKTNAWTRPVAVLVNPQTRGAAEALAAVLRTRKTALLLGGRTSGTAAVFRSLPLADGRRLRLAAAAVRTSDGLPIPLTGLEPEIRLNVHTNAELAYLSDPFALVLSGTNAVAGTNRLVNSVQVRRRVTEADLVRARRANEPETNPSTNAPATNRPPATPVAPPVTPPVRDPVLARALDLLKGLHLLRGDAKS